MSYSEDSLSYGRQNINDDDINAVVNVLRSPLLTQGRLFLSLKRLFLLALVLPMVLLLIVLRVLYILHVWP